MPQREGDHSAFRLRREHVIFDGAYSLSGITTSSDDGIVSRKTSEGLILRTTHTHTCM